MHFCFIDESGTPPPPNKAVCRNFVLAGLIIPESVWVELRARIVRVKGRYQIDSEIKWRHFAGSNRDKDNAMSHLTPGERDEVRIQLLEAVAAFKANRVIAIAVDSERAYRLPSVNTPEDLYWLAHKQLTERFQYHLQDQSREVGETIRGVVVVDHRSSSQDARLRASHAALVFRDNEYATRYENLIEGLFIAPSHLSVGIQYADLVAGAIFRHLFAQDDRFYNVIAGSIRRSPRGETQGWGIVHWPKKEGR